MDVWNYLGGYWQGEISHPVTCCCLTLAILVVAYWYLTIPSGIPPGPMGLPLLGYLPFIGDKPYLQFMELGKKYGPIFSFYLGSRLVIVLNDYTAIREAFIKQAENFAGRPIGFNMSFFRSPKDTKSISMTDGSYWKEHRRFLIHYLRDCGMGKDKIESLIMDEIQRFVVVMGSHNGRPANFIELIALSVCNNVAILAFGKRFEYDDPWFVSVKKMNDNVVESNTLNFWIAFPWLQHVPLLDAITSRTMRKVLAKIQAMLQQMLDNRETVSGNRTSYVSAFVDERERRKTDEGDFDVDSLTQNIRTLLSAGTETTANTLLWVITYMMMYPDVQAKVQREVDAVIGPDRVPNFSDRSRTPYLHATISEIQRICTLLPINIPHRNREETKILGYRIPKSTYILSNLYGVQMDPIFWKDPETFRPERFLDANGSVKKQEQFVVFSLGKRQCLGEPLARMELYLYAATMLQHFTFKLPPNQQSSLDSHMGLTLRPNHFLTCAVPRN